MSVQPEDIESKEFLVSLRGYDREEVDAFLRELAEEIRRLKSDAQTVAPSSSPAGEGDASTFYKQIGEETSKILVAAEEAGAEIRARASAEAAELLASARNQSEEVRRAGEAQKQAAEDDLRRLREARSILANQLEDVGRRLEETISRLQAPIEPATTASTTAAPPRPQVVPPPAATVIEAPPKPRPEPEVRAEPEPAPEPVPEPEPEPEVEEAPAPAEEVLEAEAAPVETTPVVEPEVEEISEPETVQEAAASDTETAPPLEDLLKEIREERERGRREVEEALREMPARETTAPTGKQEDVALARRGEVLREAPLQAARRLKRLLQEDQNDLLDRIRTHRGKGTFEGDISPADQQETRFAEGMGELLAEAFAAGRKVAGAEDEADAGQPVRSLVARQLVTPLRRELSGAVESGLKAQDTPTSIAERASDIYRVWKGVRTELLGEGLVFAAYHQGLVDVWRGEGAATKRWVLATDEQTCPRDVCKQNREAGAVAIDSAFPSGHMAPPAHGGCTCTLTGPEAGN